LAESGDDRQSVDTAREHAVENDRVPAFVCREMKPADPVTNQSGGMAGLFEAVADIAGRIRFIFYYEAAHPELL
jgi:hypothetical protein